MEYGEQKQLDEIRSKIRYAKEPDNPQLINCWLALGQAGYSVLDKRHHFEDQFRLLLDTVVDEILPSHWRCTCLDSIYRPLMELRQLVDTPESQAHLRALQNELSVTGRYVQCGLSQ